MSWSARIDAIFVVIWGAAGCVSLWRSAVTEGDLSLALFGGALACFCAARLDFDDVLRKLAK